MKCLNLALVCIHWLCTGLRAEMNTSPSAPCCHLHFLSCFMLDIKFYYYYYLKKKEEKKIIILLWFEAFLTFKIPRRSQLPVKKQNTDVGSSLFYLPEVFVLVTDIFFRDFYEIPGLLLVLLLLLLDCDFSGPTTNFLPFNASQNISGGIFFFLYNNNNNNNTHTKHITLPRPPPHEKCLLGNLCWLYVCFFFFSAFVGDVVHVTEYVCVCVSKCATRRLQCAQLHFAQVALNQVPRRPVVQSLR